MAKVMRRVLTGNGMVQIEVEIPDQELPTPMKQEESFEKNIEENIVASIEDKDVLQMSDAELKAKCEELGLSKKGSKSAKINRILEATTSNEDSL